MVLYQIVLFEIKKHNKVLGIFITFYIQLLRDVTIFKLKTRLIVI